MLTIRTEGQEQAARQWVEGPAESEPFRLGAGIAPMSLGGVARTYLGLGFTHILPKGTDHILFVLGIFLLAVRLRPILMQVTAFTIAHTITLALTIYGVVSLSPRIVEPLIALSIVYVAVENVVTPELTPWRVALVFAFGLLHGMGFAGVLAQLGLPRSQFLPALLCFNAGVELGQLTVISVAFLLIGLPFRTQALVSPPHRDSGLARHRGDRAVLVRAASGRVAGREKPSPPSRGRGWIEAREISRTPTCPGRCRCCPGRWCRPSERPSGCRSRSA